MKGFALGLALKQRRKATGKSPIASVQKLVTPSPSHREARLSVCISSIYLVLK